MFLSHVSASTKVLFRCRCRELAVPLQKEKRSDDRVKESFGVISRERPSPFPLTSERLHQGQQSTLSQAMSGISFKIQAPPRPSSSASHGGANRPTSLNLSRSASARTSDQSADASSGEDEAGEGMGSVKRNKRTRLLDDGGRGEDEEVVEFGASGAKRCAFPFSISTRWKPAC